MQMNIRTFIVKWTWPIPLAAIVVWTRHIEPFRSNLWLALLGSISLGVAWFILCAFIYWLVARWKTRQTGVGTEHR